ncbi:MAG: hypothetical protein WBO24_08230 [Nitrospirales bacterium]
MSGIDVSQFKLALTAAKKRRHEYSDLRAGLSGMSQRASNRGAVGELLKSSFTQAGVDVDTLDKMLAQHQAESRRLFQEQKAHVAKFLTSEKDTSLSAMELGLKAMEHLANLPPAVGLGLSNLIPLTTPFLIWEWPHASPDQLRDYHIESVNSYAKFLINIPVYSFDNNSGADAKELSFYFYWVNESDFLAVAKGFSVLEFNGACELAANTGFFSGDSTSLTIDAWLYPVAYWVPLQPGQTIRDLRVQGDPLQHQPVLDKTATGGGLFGDAGYVTQIFPATSYGLSFESFGGIHIPPRATAVFEVNVKFGYRWQGNTLPDEIIADFADNNLHYYVKCPLVVLELLTAPPSPVHIGSKEGRAYSV